MKKVLQVKRLTGMIETAIGLIGAKQPHAVYFQTNFGIHTFFMKFTIDVFILDSSNKVVRMKENLQPNHIFLWPVWYDKVIELPTGEIKKERIQIGDKIIF